MPSNPEVWTPDSSQELSPPNPLQWKPEPSDTGAAADKYDFTNDPQGAQERLMGDLGANGYIRGIVKGAAAPLTIPADAGIYAVNKAKQALGDDSTLNTDASDVLDHVLDKMGLKKPEGPGGTASEIAGGLIGGLTNPSFAKDISPGKWSSLANPTSQVNSDILSATARQALGVPPTAGNFGLTADVLKQAKESYGQALDIGRSPTKIFQDNPQTIANSLANIAKDEGFEADTLQELTKRPEVNKLFRLLRDGKATAEQLGEASSDLGAASAKEGGTILGRTLGQYRDFAEDAIKSTLNPQEAAQYADGLKKYKLYRTIVDSGAVNSTTGQLNPGKLLNAVKSDSGFYTGTNKSPLYDVLRKVEASQGTVDMMAEAIPGKAGYMLKSAARTVPGFMQSLTQRGIPNTLRQFANHPGFLSVLGANPDADTGEEE